MPLFRILLAVVAVSLLSHSVLAQPEHLVGRIVAISDGDTLTLLRSSDQRQYRIRLQAIDAPELRQAHGQRARQALSRLAYQRSAQALCNKVDDYGRQVCTVMIGQKDIGQQLIERGMAWHYTRYRSEQTTDQYQTYAQAERQARQQRIGLWQATTPTPPWNWRRVNPAYR